MEFESACQLTPKLRKQFLSLFLQEKASAKPCRNFTILLLIFSMSLVRTSLSCPSRCSCTSTKEVWCESKGLTSVPTGVPVDTKRLYLFDNEITTIPDISLSNLKNLQLLSLSYNSLSDTAFTPGLFSQLKNLQDLMMSDNELTNIPKSMFSGMSQLVRLDLENNKISSIDQEALQNMSNLVELKLSNNLLNNFPRFVGCPKLRRLCLGDNYLGKLQPGSLAQVNVEQLVLSGNKLTQLPSKIFQDVSNLRLLDISRNRFQVIPTFLSNITSLKTLNLSHNFISVMPKTFLTKLRKMKTLDLGNLQLTSLNDGFFPSDVYLNFIDLTRNPWNCNCDIAWLSQLMRQITGAFFNYNKVLCNSPSRLKSRSLVNLYRRDLGCTGSQSQSSIDTDIDILFPISTTRKPWIDLCVALACANGATCYINKTNFRPACKCLPGWKSVLCDKSIYQALPPIVTATTSTIMTINNFHSTLVIEEDTLTSHSVEIILPKIEKQLKVTAAQVLPNNVIDHSPIKFSIWPTKNSRFTINNLEPGTKYNICIISTDIIETSLKSKRIVEDQLCGKVTTLSITTNFPLKHPTHSINPSTNENIPIEPITNSSKANNNAVDGNFASDGNFDSTSSKAGSQLIYPIVAASIGAIVIATLVILFFVCYRKKKMVKQVKGNHFNEYGQGEGLPAASDTEAVAMMAHQRIKCPSQMTPLINQKDQNGGIYHASQHAHQFCGPSPQCMGTSSINGSLGKSGNSKDCSFNGMQRNYFSDTNVAMCCTPNEYQINSDEFRQTTAPVIPCSSSVGSYNGYGSYTNDQRRMLNNRTLESPYRLHGHSETSTETSFHQINAPSTCNPILATGTKVNQYHQGSIASTAVSSKAGCQRSNFTTSPAYHLRSPMARQPLVGMHCQGSERQQFLDMRNLHADQYQTHRTTGPVISNAMEHIF